jgi:hypothetical protein
MHKTGKLFDLGLPPAAVDHRFAAIGIGNIMTM